MTIDFGMFPPEVNSGRMYAGPGSDPMLAAAAAWDVAMAAAAAPYTAWISATADQAEWRPSVRGLC